MPTRAVEYKRLMGYMPAASVCSLCGALTRDTELHTDFHKREGHVPRG